MLTNQQKVNIAKRLINLHKESNVSNWGAYYGQCEYTIMLNTYKSLANGAFGEIIESELFNSVLIKGFESKKGSDIMFRWVS